MNDPGPPRCVVVRCTYRSLTPTTRPPPSKPELPARGTAPRRRLHHRRNRAPYCRPPWVPRATRATTSSTARKVSTRSSAGKGSDTIEGEEDDDRLNGEEGNDMVFGGDGNDRLNDQAGQDRTRLRAKAAVTA